jgi:hypothetical protein
MQQGFDCCYDERFYDRLVGGTPQALREHVSAPMDYQRHLIRFLENHDEARAASVLFVRQNRGRSAYDVTWFQASAGRAALRFQI